MQAKCYKCEEFFDSNDGGIVFEDEPICPDCVEDLGLEEET